MLIVLFSAISLYANENKKINTTSRDKISKTNSEQKNEPEKKSIYDKITIKNGEIVTSINKYNDKDLNNHCAPPTQKDQEQDKLIFQ